jgi:hypothetical protein
MLCILFGTPRIYASKHNRLASRLWRRFRITSTLALRVVKATEKEPSTGGYNWATLFFGDVNSKTWAPV